MRRPSKQADHPRDDHRERHAPGGFPRKPKPVPAPSEPPAFKSEVRILVGHVLDRLRDLPDDSVHCVVTSPPYWGLRDYKGEKQVWGGDPGCDHAWDEASRAGEGGGTKSEKVRTKGTENFQAFDATRHFFCSKCGAWHGALGLEPTADLYIQHLVEIFREVRRVLRPDGLFWLNLGDCYSRANNEHHHTRQTKYTKSGSDEQYPQRAKSGSSDGRVGRGARPGRRQPGEKPKDLMMIPARVALALQADGWWIRSDVIWAKPSAMPESIQDRPTSAHEHVFMLAKDRRYFFDQDAVRRDPAPGNNGTCNAPPFGDGRMIDGNLSKTVKRIYDRIVGGNIRNYWLINTEPLALGHFAAFPRKLVETCVKASTSEAGCCSKCGAPWRRLTGKPERTAGRGSANRQRSFDHGSRIGYSIPWEPTSRATQGWEPSCECGAPSAPAVVLDPFGGSGTVGVVCTELRRSAVLVELNPSYARMAEERISGFFVDVSRK